MHFVMVTIFAHWFFHPLHGNGYQFWSGIAGSFLTSIPGWIAAILVYLHHVNCHVKRCPRRGRFALDGTPYKLCKVHHPDVPSKITEEHIKNITNGD